MSIRHLVDKILLLGSLPEDDLHFLVRNLNTNTQDESIAEEMQLLHPAFLDLMNLLKSIPTDCETIYQPFYAEISKSKKAAGMEEVQPILTAVLKKIFDKKQLVELSHAIEKIFATESSYKQHARKALNILGVTGHVLTTLQATAELLYTASPKIEIEEKLQSAVHNIVTAEEKAAPDPTLTAIKDAAPSYLLHIERWHKAYEIHLIREMKQELRNASIPIVNSKDFITDLEHEITRGNRVIHHLLEHSTTFKEARRKHTINAQALDILTDKTKSMEQRWTGLCRHHERYRHETVKARMFGILWWIIRKITGGKFGNTHGRQLDNKIKAQADNMTRLFARNAQSKRSEFELEGARKKPKKCTQSPLVSTSFDAPEPRP